MFGRTIGEREQQNPAPEAGVNPKYREFAEAREALILALENYEQAARSAALAETNPGRANAYAEAALEAGGQGDGLLLKLGRVDDHRNVRGITRLVNREGSILAEATFLGAIDHGTRLAGVR